MNAADLASIITAATGLVAAVTALVKVLAHNRRPAGRAHPPVPGRPVPPGPGGSGGN